MRHTIELGLRVLLFAGMAMGLSSPGSALGRPCNVTSVSGAPTLPLGAYDFPRIGYRVEEFFLSGTASSYAPTQPLGEDGRWSVKVSTKAMFVTRIVVVRPDAPGNFNGTAVVEWLNVSGGMDAGPDWMSAHREILRRGYAYVAVSAQKVGIEGGPSLGADNSLKRVNPQRYASLSHPGDAFSYDIFTQVGRAIRECHSILGPLRAQRLIAVGESQSAHYLTTYINAVDALTRVFDGYLVHSRFAGAGRLDGASMMATTDDGIYPKTVRFRPDLRVPVLTVITETDLVGVMPRGFINARQPDTDRLRTWEVAGTAHGDNYLLGGIAVDRGDATPESLAAIYKPVTSFMGKQTSTPINFAPQHHYVVSAALAQLDKWIRTGRPAPAAPRLQTTDATPPALALDGNGLAEGGIRSPWVDAPTAVLSGVAPSGGNRLMMLFGSSAPFSVEALRRIYPGGKEEYLERYKASLDRAIGAGFILPDDRSEILGLAAHMYPEE